MKMTLKFLILFLSVIYINASIALGSNTTHYCIFSLSKKNVWVTSYHPRENLQDSFKIMLVTNFTTFAINTTYTGIGEKTQKLIKKDHKRNKWKLLKTFIMKDGEGSRIVTDIKFDQEYSSGYFLLETTLEFKKNHYLVVPR